ncbi:SoxR reducing system RseC family protein [Lutibacter sp. B2]|nr:SoxR reducing system RseC family protein [Lutibacter sp. B2]
MNQVGKVVEVFKNNRAKVLMKKHAACGECGACQHGEENMKLNIVGFNKVNAKIGDTVEVDMETANVLGAAFIMYVIPLFFMVVGIVGGNYFLKKLGYTTNIDMYSAGIGFILLAISFFSIRLYERKLKDDKRYIPVISKIVEE